LQTADIWLLSPIRGSPRSLRGREESAMQVRTEERSRREQDIAIIESYIAESQYDLAEAMRKVEFQLASANRLLDALRSVGE
jgi:hypothetical protein